MVHRGIRAHLGRTDMNFKSFENVYGADFETDNDGFRAWVVQWAISDGWRESTGEDVIGYMEEVHRMLEKQHKIILYFHNLKYDLSFQMRMLEQFQLEGFELTAIVRHGSPIQITLRRESDKRELQLRDSMKKMPGDLRSLGKSIGLTK